MDMSRGNHVGVLLLQPPSQVPDFCLHPRCEPNLGILSCFGPLPGPHVLILDVLLVVLDFLDDMMIHWIETFLERYVGKVWKITSNCY